MIQEMQLSKQMMEDLLVVGSTQTTLSDADRYLWVKERMTYLEATAHAESLGGQLAIIESATENAAIYNIVSEGFDPEYLLSNTWFC